MTLDRWDIIPYVGVGALRFGMRRPQVRSLLGRGISVFKKGPYAATETDACDELGLHLHYDTEDQLECIEAFGSCPIHYNGVSLLNATTNNVLERLASLGLCSRYDDGYFFDDGGFALASDEIVKAVTVYRKGYYEEETELGAAHK